MHHKKGYFLFHPATLPLQLEVRRLQRSLTSHKHLTPLHPDAMDRVTAFMGLSDDEQRRLQSALLATGVEQVLMDRMAPPQTWRLANDLIPFLLGVLRDANQETQRAGDEPPIEPLIDAWLQHRAMRTHPAPTLRAYADRLSRFRDFLRQQGHELFSTPAIITHFTPLWATTPLSRKERLAPLSHATAHKRLAILSSFYRFVVKGRFDARFTASLIPIHTAATSYWQAHPHQRGFDNGLLTPSNSCPARRLRAAATTPCSGSA